MSVTPDVSAAAAEVLALGERLRRRHRLVRLGLALGLLAAVTVGLSVGSVRVPAADVWTVVWDHVTGAPVTGAAADSDLIVWEIRLPRVLTGALVGAGLAVVGVAIQALVRNPLADPYVLGVSEGASAGAVAVIFFGAGALATGIVTPVVGAAAGALLTVVLVLALARTAGRVSSIRLLLVGVALSYAFSGLTSFFLYATRDPAAENAILFWIIGGLGGATWQRLPVVLAATVAGAAVIGWHARRLDALAVGDGSAQSLGLDPDRLRVRLFLVSSLVVAALVSVVGPIGFVGLVVPHVARMLVGADHRRLIPASLLLGATYLVLVDAVARTIFAPSEVPVGVLTALLGTPYFLWLVRRRGASVLREGA